MFTTCTRIMRPSTLKPLRVQHLKLKRTRKQVRLARYASVETADQSLTTHTTGLHL